MGGIQKVQSLDCTKSAQSLDCTGAAMGGLQKCSRWIALSACGRWTALEPHWTGSKVQSLDCTPGVESLDCTQGAAERGEGEERRERTTSTSSSRASTSRTSWTCRDYGLACLERLQNCRIMLNGGGRLRSRSVNLTVSTETPIRPTTVRTADGGPPGGIAGVAASLRAAVGSLSAVVAVLWLFQALRSCLAGLVRNDQDFLLQELQEMRVQQAVLQQDRATEILALRREHQELMELMKQLLRLRGPAAVRPRGSTAAARPRSRTLTGPPAEAAGEQVESTAGDRRRRPIERAAAGLPCGRTGVG